MQRNLALREQEYGKNTGLSTGYQLKLRDGQAVLPQCGR